MSSQTQTHFVDCSYIQSLLQFIINRKTMNYNEVFKCPICCLDFDKQARRPMIICQNHHTICEVCLNDICNQSNVIFNCPICRTPTTKEQALYSKSFFSYRQQAKELISFKNKIQVEKKQLKSNMKKLEDRLLKSNKDLNQQISIISKKQAQIIQLRKKIDSCHIYEQKLNKYIDKLTEQCNKHQKTLQMLKEERRKNIEASSFLSKENGKLIQKLEQSQSKCIRFEQIVIKQRQIKDELYKKIEFEQKQYATQKQDYLKQLASLKNAKKSEIVDLSLLKNDAITSNQQQVQYFKNLCDFHIRNQNKLSNKVIKLEKRIVKLKLLADKLQEQQRQQYHWQKIAFDFSLQIQKLHFQIQQNNGRPGCICFELKRILSKHKMEIQNLTRANQEYSEQIVSLSQRYNKQAQIKTLLIRTVDNLTQVNDQNRALIKELKGKNRLLTQTAANLQQQNPQTNQKGFFSSLFK